MVKQNMENKKEMKVTPKLQCQLETHFSSSYPIIES